MMAAEACLRHGRIFALAVVSVVAAAAPARADGFITPYIGYNFGGDSANCQTLTNCEEKHTNIGVSLASASGIFGFEEDIGYATDFFASVPGTDNNVFTAMSNVMAGWFAGPVQPYLLAGVGLIRTHVSFNPATSGPETSNAFGYDLGGGVSGFVSRHLGFRGDLRHLHTFQDVAILHVGPINLVPDERLDFWRASIGLSLRF